MTVSVPADVVQYIQQASQGTGIGFNTVACQVNEESGFNAGAVSPTGAQGPYQFEPGTWASYGSGSPFNWEDSTRAYIAFMNALAREFSNDIFNMLAAYNAGPGNIQAGYGYATVILDCAGAGVNTQRANPETNVGSGSPTQASQSTDDWSQKVRNSADQFHFAGTNALTAANAIRGL